MAGGGEVSARVKATVAKLAAGMKVQKKDAPRPGAIVTMAQLGAAWTSNELAEKYPDHVKTKRTADKDEAALRNLEQGYRPPARESFHTRRR